MPPTAEARKRGRIDTLPSGSMRVRVFAGYDPVTEKRFDLTETVPARSTARETRREAEKVRTKLLN